MNKIKEIYYHPISKIVIFLIFLWIGSSIGILYLENGELSEIKNGSEVELVIVNPDEKWIFKDADIHSKSKNTPFLNQEFKGKINFTIHKNILFG